jgi:ribosomal protein RSM22 (predicted rRNA methylase)
VIELPQLLQEKIDTLLEKISPSELKEAFEELSKNYRKDGVSPRLFRNEAIRLAYLASRLPATYAAAFKVLSLSPSHLSSWIDVGAGPATASWAGVELFSDVKSITLLEKNREIALLGKALAEDHPVLSKAELVCQSHFEGLEKKEALIFSYSLGELENWMEWVDWWWQENIPFLIVIEPGTPSSFTRVCKLRDEVIARGGFIVAPCTHLHACPMQKNDWCHFSTRVARSRLQRYLKGGSLGYEDEKFSYLIASRKSFVAQDKSRIVRHPLKQSGFVQLTLCTSHGAIEKRSVTRKNKDLYKEAKNVCWGDLWDE